MAYRGHPDCRKRLQGCSSRTSAKGSVAAGLLFTFFNCSFKKNPRLSGMVSWSTISHILVSLLPPHTHIFGPLFKFSPGERRDPAISYVMNSCVLSGALPLESLTRATWPATPHVLLISPSLVHRTATVTVREVSRPRLSARGFLLCHDHRGSRDPAQFSHPSKLAKPLSFMFGKRMRAEENSTCCLL